jgi:uncharacterized protein involved in tolerance to divalent cations
LARWLIISSWRRPWVTNTLPALAPTAQIITANHSCDVPEIIATPIIGGSAEHLSWLVAETRD